MLSSSYLFHGTSPSKAPVRVYLRAVAAPGSAPFHGPTLAVGVGPALEIASCKICCPATMIVASCLDLYLVVRGDFGPWRNRSESLSCSVCLSSVPPYYSGQTEDKARSQSGQTNLSVSPMPPSASRMCNIYVRTRVVHTVGEQSRFHWFWRLFMKRDMLHYYLLYGPRYSATSPGLLLKPHVHARFPCQQRSAGLKALGEPCPI